MNTAALRELLVRVREGEIGLEAALERIRRLPFEDLGFATIDTHRALRCGFPEVIFCQGKTPEQVAAIAERLLASDCEVLASRADAAAYEAVRAICPGAEHHEAARMIVCNRKAKEAPPGKILVVSAGTSDVPVAEEARITAELMGNRVDRLYDVGVAGIHRLLQRADHVFDANVLIVVAGMEGALASVVGGLTSRPVIGVPTSIGYGASFGGLAALLAMLNSCASGVCVVNIDNGFGAGYIASLINHTNLPPTGREGHCKPGAPDVAASGSDGPDS
jgi:NCAIR mutase (PurE)-related protein